VVPSPPDQAVPAKNSIPVMDTAARAKAAPATVRTFLHRGLRGLGALRTVAPASGPVATSSAGMLCTVAGWAATVWSVTLVGAWVPVPVQNTVRTFSRVCRKEAV
jgi:hypothetical protein